MSVRRPVLLASFVLPLACTATADIGGVTQGTEAAGSTTHSGSSDGGTEGVSTEGADSTATSAGEESDGPPADETGMPPLLDVGNDDPVRGCDTDVGDYIFLLDADGGLHRLAPATLEVEALGQLDCEGADAAMAMTVDRNGMLWAMMVDAQGFRSIYTIDPISLVCSATDFVDPVNEDIGVNALAFVADEPGGKTESLYVGANVGGSFDVSIPLSLGRVDLATMDMEIVGTAELVPTGYYQIADLTGTGDSRLFGFFPGDTAAIAELDDADSSIVESELLDFGVGSPWAFAQWAGRLWLFSSGGNPGSDIRAWDPANGDVEDISAGIGVSVVGAAVSTCAPYQPEG